MALKFVDELELKDKKIICRFDFNVPLKDGKITDSTRIDNALPTIKYIAEQGARKIILMSHLGRPKGEVKPEFSLEPVAEYLAQQLGKDVILTESAIDSGINNLLNLPETKFVLLQNLRYHPEEKKGDKEFAEKLSSYADIYINDAFGAAHRKHASTYTINAFFDKNHRAAGFLLKRELENLNKVVKEPSRPLMAIVGGAKVSDKIGTIESLLINAQELFIGGAMAYPFLKAQGHTVGKSLCSDEDVELAKKILKEDRGGKLNLPCDHIISDSPDGAPENCDSIDIPEGKMGLDVGAKTIAAYDEKLKNAKTVLWNGPLGLFENENYAKGTMSIAETLANLDAFTLVGGGDSVSAVKKSGKAEKFSHISTGGGASLEYIEKGELPGVKALNFGVE
ncbi:MAG: phosphoglycerate kinase [Bacteriovoracia bacterium]